MKSPLLFLVYVVSLCYGGNVRVYFNYIENNNHLLLYVDYSTSTQTTTRVAQMVPPGVLNVMTNNGYAVADDTNVWGWLTNTDPGLGNYQQLVEWSHNYCLSDLINFGGHTLSSLGLDPNAQLLYYTYQSLPGLGRVRYDGTGSVIFPYLQAGTFLQVVDYQRNRTVLLPSTSGLMFNIFDLTTNLTAYVNASSPLSGGLSVDLTTGRVYCATLSQGILSYDPASGLFSPVYANTDYTFRGLTVDSLNQVIFFAADRAKEGDSQLMALNVNLASGTAVGSPVVLTSTEGGKFVSTTVAHCPLAASCGPCGTLRPTNPAQRISVGGALISIFLFLFGFF